MIFSDLILDVVPAMHCLNKFHLPFVFHSLDNGNNEKKMNKDQNQLVSDEINDDDMEPLDDDDMEPLDALGKLSLILSSFYARRMRKRFNFGVNLSVLTKSSKYLNIKVNFIYFPSGTCKFGQSSNGAQSIYPVCVRSTLDVLSIS